MKELSIEEKAKRYDEALGKARQLCAYPTTNPFISDLQDLFPELAESEDERIREEMLQIAKESEDSFYMVLTPNKREKLIAWLEKQGEETSWKPSKEEMDALYGIEDDVRRRSTIQVLEYARGLDTYNQYGKADIDKNIAWLEKQGKQIDIANKEYWRGYREGKKEILDKYAELEKQGEQKSIDAVEPRFHEGDFIKHNKANIICKVISVISGSYFVENIETSCRVELFNAEQLFHLWTIKDAKDGDVLACKNGWTCIFKCLNDNVFSSHCFMDSGGWFCKDGGQAHTLNNSINIHPATKEQRELFFTKMKESGHE